MNSILNPNTAEGYDLLAAGSLALADIEMNGVRTDVKYLKRKSEELAVRLRKMEHKLLYRTDTGALMRKIYGNNVNINSVKQVHHIFFKELKYKLPNGKQSTDDTALLHIGTDFCKQLTKYRSLTKTKSTYIDNIVTQSSLHDDGDYYIHPTFSVNLVSTFRSSSFDPNLQSIPVRDVEISKLVRSALRARRGHQLMEVDYKGVEVSASACYHEDPNMVAYLHDATTDMHRDTAADCFCISDTSLISKDIRQATKTFVFGEFYGDWYEPQARILWESMLRGKFKMTNNVYLKDHLKTKGIYNLYQFTEHMKEVERILWEERFAVYSKWKDTTWEEFINKGYIYTKTGFTIQGLLDKKQVCNSPIQGTAFHWLLWALTKANRWAKINGLRSRPIGQVHDSILWDIYPAERDYVAEKMHSIMTKEIYSRFNWINVPMNIDIDLSPVDATWHDKESWSL